MGAPKGRPKPRGSGRQKGVGNKPNPLKEMYKHLTVDELIEGHKLAQRLILDEGYLETVVRRLHAGQLNPTLEQMLWHYAFGKPPETITIKGDEDNPLTVKLAQAHERIRSARHAA